MRRSTVLIVDDEKNLRDAIKMGLEDTYRILEASDGLSALETVNKEEIDVVLLDMKLPDTDGIKLLENIKKTDDTINIIMLTADNTVRSAVRSMKLGAYDYITKPFDIEELSVLISKALEKRLLQKENITLKAMGFRASKKIITESKLIKEIIRSIDTIAGSDSTVLITGETGVGKELFAMLIHQKSKRAKMPFVPVNCAAIPENLIESELFGHERGSFTGAIERHIGKFEIANHGTIFLDEVGSLPSSMQAKLLRVLQDRIIERVGGERQIQVDCRVLAATNIDLKDASSHGSFRSDLFFRLNVIPIRIPPLRERTEDIEPLIDFFLNKFNKTFRSKVRGFTKEAVALMKTYAWPGNVRELENLIEHLTVLSKESHIRPQDLPFEISNIDTSASAKDIATLSLKEATKRFEHDFIRKVLEKTGGSKSLAAKILGVHRNTLLKIEKKSKLQ